MVRESSRVAAWRLGPSGLSTKIADASLFTFVLIVRHRCLLLLAVGGRGNRNLGYQ